MGSWMSIREGQPTSPPCWSRPLRGPATQLGGGGLQKHVSTEREKAHRFTKSPVGWKPSAPGPDGAPMGLGEQVEALQH
eukprot:3323261-Pyramimonas_sp.AAC.1